MGEVRDADAVFVPLVGTAVVTLLLVGTAVVKL